MSVIGSLASAGGHPGACGVSSFVVISDISTNSKSNSFFTTFVGREAAGLNGRTQEVADGSACMLADEPGGGGCSLQIQPRRSGRGSEGWESGQRAY